MKTKERTVVSCLWVVEILDDENDGEDRYVDVVELVSECFEGDRAEKWRSDAKNSREVCQLAAKASRPTPRKSEQMTGTHFTYWLTQRET